MNTQDLGEKMIIKKILNSTVRVSVVAISFMFCCANTVEGTFTCDGEYEDGTPTGGDMGQYLKDQDPICNPTINPFDEAVVRWMAANVPKGIGNILVAQLNNGQIVVLQSGIQLWNIVTGANQFIETIAAHAAPGAEVIGLSGLDIVQGHALEANELQYVTKLLVTNTNTLLTMEFEENLDDFIKNLLINLAKYVGEVSVLEEVEKVKDLSSTAACRSFVRSKEGSDGIKILLTRVSTLSSARKIAVLSEILKSIQRVNADPESAVTHGIKIKELINDKKGNIFDSGSLDAKHPVVEGLNWLKRAFHTEIQLKVYMNQKGIGLPANTPIYSLFEPCESCEQSRAVADWIRNGTTTPFISLHRDQGKHSNTHSFRYTHTTGIELNAYLTIKRD